MDSEQIKKFIIQKAIDRGIHLSCAESCTGGNIAAALTSVPGASKVFLGGIIAYHPKIKEAICHVDPNTIASKGVVSVEVASQMALGACCVFGSNFSIATTGVAGPGADSDGIPAGTIAIAVASSDKVFFQKMFHLVDLGRSKNMQSFTDKALEVLSEFLKAELDEKVNF